MLVVVGVLEKHDAFISKFKIRCNNLSTGTGLSQATLVAPVRGSDPTDRDHIRAVNCQFT
jgi:hypothetical protein